MDGSRNSNARPEQAGVGPYQERDEDDADGDADHGPVEDGRVDVGPDQAEHDGLEHRPQHGEVPLHGDLDGRHNALG